MNEVGSDEPDRGRRWFSSPSSWSPASTGRQVGGAPTVLFGDHCHLSLIGRQRLGAFLADRLLEVVAGARS